MPKLKVDKEIIDYLNEALKLELTAINQYFLHSRLLEDWGATKMAKFEYDESIEEMQHADKLIQRILLLGGLPNLQDLGKLRIGEDIKEVLEADLAGERDGIANYRKAIAACEKHGDYVTAQMLKHMLEDEEGHEDHLESQIDLLDKIGMERYLQLQSGYNGEDHGGE